MFSLREKASFFQLSMMLSLDCLLFMFRISMLNIDHTQCMHHLERERIDVNSPARGKVHNKLPES